MIEVCKVSKSYGDVHAAVEVSLNAADSAVTAFVGENGAGKSTVLRAVVGVGSPGSGSVLVDGRPLREAPIPARSMGVLLDARSLPAHMTALGFLLYVCDTQRLSNEAAHRALDRVELAAVKSRRIGTYSLGMRQRLGIAAADIARPSNLVFDEPLNGLDPACIRWFRSFLIEAKSRGTAVLLSSHLMAELALVADDVVMIDGGRIVASGPLREFVGERSAPDVYIEVEDRAVARAAFDSRRWRHTDEGAGIVVSGIEPRDVGEAAFSSGARLTRLAARERSLEESYFQELAALHEGEVL